MDVEYSLDFMKPITQDQNQISLLFFSFLCLFLWFAYLCRKDVERDKVTYRPVNEQAYLL